MTPSSIALTLPAIPIEPIYFEPPIVNSSDEIKHLNCVALDNNIQYLDPHRYSYKPGFYQDDANKIATALITVDSLPVIGTVPVIGE